MDLDAPKVAMVRALLMHHMCGVREDGKLIRCSLSLNLPGTLIRTREPPFDLGILHVFSLDSSGCHQGLIL